ncbi:MAG: transporter substrate-binding domain-containing protein [Fibrobacterales bacterium]
MKPFFVGYMIQSLLSIVLLCVLGVFSNGVVRFAIQNDYPPYLTEKEDDGGLYTELVTAAYAEVGYSVEYHFVPWARALHGTKAGLYDVVLGLYYTKEREEFFLYSNPIDTLKVFFFKKITNDFEYTDLQSLKGLYIGVGRGYANSSAFDKATHFTRVEAVSNTDNFTRLAKERLDLVVENEGVGYRLLLDVENGQSIVPIHPPLEVHLSHVGVSKKSKHAKRHLKAFNRGLAAIKNNGKYRRIFEKYGFSKP